MARYVREFLKELPEETRKEVGKCYHLTNPVALKRLKDKNVPVVTPISKVREIAKDKSEKLDLPITVSDNRLFYTSRNIYADGLAVEYPNQKFQIILHPLVQYRSKNYIKDLINHEHDHIRVFKKKHGIQKPISKKRVIGSSIGVMR